MDSTQFEMTERSGQLASYKFFFFMSFLIWLLATVLMRLWGQTFFIAENALSMEGCFLAFLLGLPLLTYTLFRWKGIQPAQRSEAAICLSIPALLLDVGTTCAFTEVYPNMPPATASAYAAWLMWGYALILITGFVTSRTGDPHVTPADR